MTENLTQACLKSQLSYDPSTGLFHWINSGKGRSTDRPAGTVGEFGPRGTGGYVRIYVGGYRYLAHRLAWLYVYGSMPPDERCIDHINGLRSDNRIENLRLASRSENAINSGIYKSNTTGFKGVSYHRGEMKYSATATVEGKTRHLGYYQTAQGAHAAYVKFMKSNFGDFLDEKKLCKSS